MTPRVDRSEDGFTIIELMVSFLVLAIIVVPLSSSVIIGLASAEQATQRTTDTSDQQVLASYFSHDVQSADDVQTTSACGAAAGTPILQLQWTDPVSAGVKTASYVVTAGKELHRVFCDGAATKTVIVSHALGSTPTVKCDGAACPAGASTPRSVSMHVSVIGSEDGEPSHDPYAFDVSATRRVTA